MKIRLPIIVFTVVVLTFLSISFKTLGQPLDFLGESTGPASIYPGEGKCGNQKWVKVFEATIGQYGFVNDTYDGTEFNPKIINPYLSASQLLKMINQGCSFRVFFNYVTAADTKYQAIRAANFDCERIEFTDINSQSSRIFTCRSTAIGTFQEYITGVKGENLKIIFLKNNPTPHLVLDANSYSPSITNISLYAKK